MALTVFKLFVSPKLKLAPYELHTSCIKEALIAHAVTGSSRDRYEQEKAAEQKKIADAQAAAAAPSKAGPADDAPPSPTAAVQTEVDAPSPRPPADDSRA